MSSVFDASREVSSRILEATNICKSTREFYVKLLDGFVGDTWTTREEKEEFRQLCTLIILGMEMSISNMNPEPKFLSINEINNKFVKLDLYYQIIPIEAGSLTITLVVDNDRKNNSEMDQFLRMHAAPNYKEVGSDWNSDKFINQFLAKFRDLYRDDRLANYIMNNREESFVNRFNTFCETYNFRYALRHYDGMSCYLHTYQ